MDRRKAIGSILVLGVGGAGAVEGWLRLGTRRADLSLLDRHYGLIGGLVDTIIPATDTPGAVEAGVPAFIVKMVREAADPRAQRTFVEGLEETARLCRDRFGRPFTACSADQRGDVLRYWRHARAPGVVGRLQRRWSGRSFYELLHSYTILGYCTSEAGVRHALAYDPIPGGPFQGCLPLRPGQRAWATF